MLVYQNIIQYLLLAFAFFLPLHERISTLILGATVLVLIIALVQGKIGFNNKYNSTLLILPGLFLVYLVSLTLLSENNDFKFIESKLSLLAFPFIFFSQLKIDKIKVLKFFVFGCGMAYFICLANSIASSFVFENGTYVFNPLRSDSRTFFEAIVYEGNYFFGKYFSALYHTSYFAFYQCFALQILLTYRKNFKKPLFLALIFVFPLGIVQTMSMAGYASLVIIISIFTLLNVNSKKLKLLLISSVFLTITCGLMFHPRLKNLVKDISKKELVLNPESLDGVMLRLLSWDASLDIINENPVVGVGIGDAQAALNSIYEQKGYIQPLKRNLNAHNQYLQLYVESGIVGVLIVLYLFVVLLKNSKSEGNRNRILIVSFTALIAFNFIFESVLSRYLGISFFSFFCCILTYSLKKKNNFEKVQI